MGRGYGCHQPGKWQHKTFLPTRKQQTNNRAGLYAGITAVRRALSKVVTVTGSESVFKGVNHWTHAWRKHGWLIPQGPVEHTGPWVGLLLVLGECTATIVWLWSLSPTGIEGNEEAD